MNILNDKTEYTTNKVAPLYMPSAFLKSPFPKSHSSYIVLTVHENLLVYLALNTFTNFIYSTSLL